MSQDRLALSMLFIRLVSRSPSTKQKAGCSKGKISHPIYGSHLIHLYHII